MGNASYRFNPKTLTFENNSKKFKFFTKRIMAVIGSAVILGVLFSVFIISHYETPKMRSLKSENKKLLSQYNFLNKKVGNLEGVLKEMQVRDDNIYRLIFNSDPIPESVRKAGSGGSEKYNDLSFEHSELITSTAKKIDEISKQAYIQAKSYEEVLKMAKDKQAELASTPAIRPLAQKDISYMSSGWGMRMHPIFKVWRFHAGIDFVAPRGTNVYATADGVVQSVVNLGDGHGKHIVINHGFGYQTVYAHLNRFNVTEGQRVKRGELIGFVGSTGTSTSPHLHYEVIKDGKNINPIDYFFKDVTPEEQQQIIASSKSVAVSFD